MASETFATLTGEFLDKTILKILAKRICESNGFSTEIENTDECKEKVREELKTFLNIESSPTEPAVGHPKRVRTPRKTSPQFIPAKTYLNLIKEKPQEIRCGYVFKKGEVANMVCAAIIPEGEYEKNGFEVRCKKCKGKTGNGESVFAGILGCEVKAVALPGTSIPKDVSVTEYLSGAVEESEEIELESNEYLKKNSSYQDKISKESFEGYNFIVRVQMDSPEDIVLGKIKEDTGFKENYLEILEKLSQDDIEKVENFKDLEYKFYEEKSEDKEEEEKEQEQSDLDLLLNSV